jgi:hypothetical protein
VKGEADDQVTRVANSILAAIVRDATFKGASGPFTLDDFLRAWLEHEPEMVATLPDPPGTTDSSPNQRRTYWFYEGCHALEEGAWIAEVGDGKFAIASLTELTAQMLHARAGRPD